MKKTKKIFEELLNKEPKWKNNQYGNRTRKYGTYLRNQDKILFEFYYKDWIKNQEIK